ncbi:hypothetical protein METHP14_50045 [Pseudomonas sp. P14-2025]
MQDRPSHIVEYPGATSHDMLTLFAQTMMGTVETADPATRLKA